MSGRDLATELDNLLLDVDTAPDEGDALNDALDSLTDWVQDNRAAILERLRGDATPVTVSVPDQRCLSAYMTLVEAVDGVNYVPQAVQKRGAAYIPTECPGHMTEAMFQQLLEAEAQAVEDRGEENTAAGLRADLKRRRQAFEAQARRDAQHAALAPLAGRQWRPAPVAI